MTTSTNKALLRQALRLKRQQLSLSQQEQKSTAAAQHLITLPLFQTTEHVAGYWPIDSEISPLPIFEKAFAQNKHCYLPVVQKENKHLHFVEYLSNDALIPNRYGILEPDPIERSSLPVEQLDLNLVPLVGFDTHGHRLGMGAGYYDQTLRALHQKTQRPFVLGIAFELQHIETLPKDDWDIALDGILTEDRYLAFI